MQNRKWKLEEEEKGIRWLDDSCRPLCVKQHCSSVVEVLLILLAATSKFFFFLLQRKREIVHWKLLIRTRPKFVRFRCKSGRVKRLPLLYVGIYPLRRMTAQLHSVVLHESMRHPSATEETAAIQSCAFSINVFILWIYLWFGKEWVISPFHFDFDFGWAKQLRNFCTEFLTDQKLWRARVEQKRRGCEYPRPIRRRAPSYFTFFVASIFLGWALTKAVRSRFCCCWCCW